MVSDKARAFLEKQGLQVTTVPPSPKQAPQRPMDTAVEVPATSPPPAPINPQVNVERDPELEGLKTQNVESPINTDSYPKGAHTENTIEGDFEEAFNLHPNNDFLDSIYTWWDEKGFLTASQYEQLQFLVNGHM